MERFKNLDESKQMRILNAALQEFAEHGYEQASTNRIVKQAGIGKGMLFYYFNSKQELYQYLISYSIETIRDHYIRRIDSNEADVIKRWKQATRIKMEALAEHPYVFMFMGTLLLAHETDLPAGLETRVAEVQRLAYTKLYENVDTSLFRTDIDVDKAFHLIRWSIEGYQNELESRLKGQKMSNIDLEPYWEEFYEYLDVLRTIFYKKEENEK